MKYSVVSSLAFLLIFLSSDHALATEEENRKDALSASAVAPNKLNEHEEFFVRSLQPGSSNDPNNLDYFERNKCMDRTVKCYLLLSAAGNLLIDNGDLKNGLKAAIYGYELIHDTDYCPVAYEAVAINYKLKKIRTMPAYQASKQAQSLLDKIKHAGGISNDLRVESCVALRARSPFYFEEYAELVEVLHSLAD